VIFIHLGFLRNRFALRNLTNEAITPAMHGFNEARRLRIIAESFAQLTNGHFENGFANECSRPYSVEKFLLRDQLSRTSNQIPKYCKSLGPDLYFPCPIPQAFVRRIEGKGIEDDEFWVRHWTPALPKHYGRFMTLMDACSIVAS